MRQKFELNVRFDERSTVRLGMHAPASCMHACASRQVHAHAAGRACLELEKSEGQLHVATVARTAGGRCSPLSKFLCVGLYRLRPTVVSFFFFWFRVFVVTSSRLFNVQFPLSFAHSVLCKISIDFRTLVWDVVSASSTVPAHYFHFSLS